LEESYSQAPRAGHKDAEAFWSAGAGQRDLADDETGGQYNSLFVLPAPGPPSPAPCHSKAGIQELIDVIKVWHDFATASEGCGSRPGSVGGGGAPHVLFSPQKKGRSWAYPRHEIGIKRLSGKCNGAGLAATSSCRVIIRPGKLLHPIPPQQHLWQEMPDPTLSGVQGCAKPAGLCGCSAPVLHHGS